MQLSDKFEPNYPRDLSSTMGEYLKATGFESSQFRQLAGILGGLEVCVPCPVPSAAITQEDQCVTCMCESSRVHLQT